MNLKDKLKNLRKKRSMLGLSSVLMFGKYKKHKIDDVIQQDPKYLGWLVDENIILLDDETYTEVQDAIVLANTKYNLEDFL